jgi:DNA-binding NtrC family response regulator
MFLSASPILSANALSDRVGSGSFFRKIMGPDKLPLLIVLDDDTKTLGEVEELARAWFQVVGTRSPVRALNLARSEPNAAVFMAAQQLGATSGIAVLKAVQTLRPDVRRLLMTDPGHLTEIIDGLHCGAVSAIVYKPLGAEELAAALDMACRQPKRAG